MHKLVAAMIGVTAMSLAAADPASAQKSKDTLRIAITEPMRSLDPYTYALREGSFMYTAVYESLIEFDQRNKKYVPQLAKSWTQPSRGVYEFELRDDLKFHNGNPFSADDVIATINWVIAPEEKRIYSKHRYTWVSKVEKLGPHKIRITSGEPTPFDMTLLSLRYPIYDGKVLNALDDKVNYGRTGLMGTGPYKVTAIDTTRVNFERHAAYQADTPYRVKARVGNIHGIVINDSQTQIAQLMVGNIDMVRDPSEDQMKEMAKQPNLSVVATPSLVMTYLQLDAAGRSAKKELTDLRVRRALGMAIDRNALLKIVPGGDAAEVMDAMCFKAMIGCDVDPVKPPKYDPAAAKKLLAEAGYPNGFEMTIIAPRVTREIAVAISGFWNAIGVKAKVETVTVQVLRDRREENKMEAMVMYRTYQNIPDASGLIDSFYLDTWRDFSRDAKLNDLAKKADTEFDLAKREQFYKGVLDMTNEQMYLYPITSLPFVFVVSKDVAVHKNALSNNDLTMMDVSFK